MYAFTAVLLSALAASATPAPALFARQSIPSQCTSECSSYTSNCGSVGSADAARCANWYCTPSGKSSMQSCITCIGGGASWADQLLTGCSGGTGASASGSDNTGNSAKGSSAGKVEVSLGVVGLAVLSALV